MSGPSARTVLGFVFVFIGVGFAVWEKLDDNIIELKTMLLCFGVALFGAYVIVPTLVHGALGEAKDVVDRYAPKFGHRATDREPVRLQVPEDTPAVVERASAPNVAIPPHAAPVVVAEDATPDEESAAAQNGVEGHPVLLQQKLERDA